MKRYLNREGHSGVVAYDIRNDSIAIKFAGGDTYEYTGQHPGREHVEAMKQLAIAGRGLATYISRHVRDDYARKF